MKESESFAGFIQYARVYFDASATKEMLELWRNRFCPFDTEMSTGLELFKLFAPTILYEHEEEHGYK